MTTPAAATDTLGVVERNDKRGVLPTLVDAFTAHRRVWLLNAVMAAGALAVYASVIRRIPSPGASLTISWPVLIALFTASESWRVYLHFRKSSHSFSLSEIPMVIGLFFSTSDGMLLARVIGVFVALGAIRRHAPVKLCFNAALFALQVEGAEIALQGVTSQGAAPGPLAWLAVISVFAALEVVGTAVVMVAVALTEGTPQWSDRLQDIAFSLAIASVDTCLALEAVAILWRNGWELLLLIIPVGAVATASSILAAERRRHQRIQYLYESSSLLSRAGGDTAAITALLAKICTIFRASRAELTLLPTGREDRDAVRICVDRDDRVEVRHVTDVSVLEEALAFVDTERRGLVVRGDEGDEVLAAMVKQRDFRDLMVVALRGDERITGLLLVGNDSAAINSFREDDLQLFETLAAQAAVALENGRLEAQLKHQAFHDTLTNLANRALFTDRVSHALARRATVHDTLACVLFVDLDDFKTVNDSLGHAGGDALLCQVAERLQGSVRAFDTAARFGGDEFAILLEEVESIDAAVDIAERVLTVLTKPYQVHGRQLSIGASVGISSSSVGAGTANELIARADMAMYRAKQRGKGCFEIYEPGMQDAAISRLELKTELEAALERGDLVVHYQPIVELATGELRGVEALVRWPHAELGNIPPARFIPVAEDTGLIDAIGEFVLLRACEDAGRWLTATSERQPIYVSVNVSPRQLQRGHFRDTVAYILAATGLPPRLLTLEITESWMVPDADAPLQLLSELKSLGVRLSIDDFGTGYSSLSCLEYLPVDVLKIAKPFVDGIADTPRKLAFGLAITRLGKTLALDLVAEGIETRAQLDRLLDLHCDYGQGFYFSPAVPAAEIDVMLRQAPGLADGVIPFPGRATAV